MKCLGIDGSFQKSVASTQYLAGSIAPLPSYSVQCHILVQFSTSNFTLNEYEV